MRLICADWLTGEKYARGLNAPAPARRLKGEPREVWCPAPDNTVSRADLVGSSGLGTEGAPDTVPSQPLGGDEKPLLLQMQEGQFLGVGGAVLVRRRSTGGAWFCTAKRSPFGESTYDLLIDCQAGGSDSHGPGAGIATTQGKSDGRTAGIWKLKYVGGGSDVIDWEGMGDDVLDDGYYNRIERGRPHLKLRGGLEEKVLMAWRDAWMFVGEGVDMAELAGYHNCFEKATALCMDVVFKVAGLGQN